MSNFGRLITNKRGDYLWLTSTDTSRFQGWFLRFRQNLIKVVDNLEATGDNETSEKFSLAPKAPVLNYKLGQAQFVNVDLDIRASYSNPKWGRNFKIDQDDDKIIISYHYNHPDHADHDNADTPRSPQKGISEFTPKPDAVGGSGLSVRGEYSEPRSSVDNQCRLCVVLKTPQKSFFTRVEDWVKKNYPYDKKRNSPPAELYIFRSLKVKVNSLSITAAPTKKRALANLHYAKKDSPVLVRKRGKIKRKNESDLLKDINTDSNSSKNVLRRKILKKAKQQAQNSLQSLLVTKDYENSCEYREGFRNKKGKTEEWGFEGARAPYPPPSIPPISSPRSQISDLRYRGEFTPNRASCREPCFAQVLRRSGSGPSVSLQAGLPWFFQFWSRDELISLKGFASVEPKAAFRILKQNLNNIREDGRLPNIKGPNSKKQANDSADAVGWLFARAREFLKATNSDFPHHSRFSIKEPLEFSLRGLLEDHTNGQGLAVNDPGETWMDTVYKGDERSGAKLEVQALRLNMYNLAYELTQKKRYKELEKKLKQKVREIFWTGSYLKDGKDDSTIRPNIFLAYYLYPELLSEENWRSCFDKALKQLWCDWGEARNFTEGNRGTPRKKNTEHHGRKTRNITEHLSHSAMFRVLVQQGSAPLGGIASIDKNHSLFCSQHTGEDPKSYHRGDSWFWVNNLAAVSMLRLDSERYQDRIQKITNASVVDLFEGQIPGHASELSSASSFSPAGSPCQAWSAATLIELIDELQSQNFTEENR